MEKKHLIGIDMGATNLRAGLIENDQLLKIETEKIDRSGKAERINDQILGCIDQLKTSATKGIGIGVPSVVDVKKGIVYDVVNIPAWKEVHLKDIIEKQFDIPVHVNNDANCFALGEKYFGKGKGFKSMIGVTIGSGMGCGVILDDKLYSGPNCGAGEIGNVPYKGSIMEHYSSGQFFERFFNISGKEIFKYAKRKNQRSLEAYKIFGTHVGNALKTIMYMYDPECIVLGGSVSQAYSFFEISMMDVIEGFGYPKSLERLKIKVTEQQHISILGAAALVLDAE